MKRKGIILAGGAGTRLHPLTLAVSKQLLPIYDKPMIYYPLSTLMLAGLREILIITTPEDAASFHRLLGSGAQWGLDLHYAVQPKPEGLAQALVIAELFLDGAAPFLILGDNLLHGHGLPETLQRTMAMADGATIFATRVEDPERYGVVAFDRAGRATSIEEKPTRPRSDWAVIGLYVFDCSAVDRARALRPSTRGEYEITDLNRTYLGENILSVERLGRGFTWFDAGTHASLLDASEFVRVVQASQNQLIASPEEIAFNAGWIDGDDLARLAVSLGKTNYGRALEAVLEARGATRPAALRRLG